ncbi:MAG: PPOX class F420-dependent oxidoreductase [Acidimicrobiales bacterium]
MSRKLATETPVGRDDLIKFVRPRHQWTLVTLRRDGRPQISPVTGGVLDDGTLAVATYPFRDKVRNLRRDPWATVCVLSDHFGGAWVQVDGRATVLDVPEALDALVAYYRAIGGEHPHWDEYREAMVRQGKCLIAIEPLRWGPVATGGFPPSVASVLDLAERLGADDTPR